MIEKLKSWFKDRNSYSPCNDYPCNCPYCMGCFDRPEDLPDNDILELIEMAAEGKPYTP